MGTWTSWAWVPGERLLSGWPQLPPSPRISHIERVEAAVGSKSVKNMLGVMGCGVMCLGRKER